MRVHLRIPSLIVVLLFACYSNVFSEPLTGIKTFAYQLQDISPSALRDSAFDLIIMDYASDGTDTTAFSRATIDEIAGARAGRQVVAYLSIGEAEDYRFYWNAKWTRQRVKKKCRVVRTRRAPDWLEDPNPNFCGNYKTKYWLRAWQRIIFGVSSGTKKSYLDRIIDAGFNGVYLDIIDGYEYWSFDKPRALRRRTAARDMAQLVERIGRYARVTKNIPDFVVIPQNGAGILAALSATWRSRYLAAIDGIGAEDSYYFGDDDENNRLDPQETTIAALTEFLAAGKQVFMTDYLTDSAKIVDFQARACAAGFIPQVATRALDSLETQGLQGCV